MDGVANIRQKHLISLRVCGKLHAMPWPTEARVAMASKAAGTDLGAQETSKEIERVKWRHVRHEE